MTSDPRVLIISNNALSETNNNGKTLASFFDGFSTESVAQLYFSDEIPCGSHVKNYFRISDRDVFFSLLLRSRQCGALVTLRDYAGQNKQSFSPTVSHIKNCNSVRLARELLWKVSGWQSDEFISWVREFSPEIVFFVAGDSGFAYRVMDHVRTVLDAKLVVYITDDYILPRKTLNPVWWLRRKFIFKKMKKAVASASLFVTISDKMRNTYRDVFGKDSIIAVNMSEPLSDSLISENKKNDRIELVYAGGLHFKRYETLGLLATSIRQLNESGIFSRKIVLKVYSTTPPSSEVLKIICVEDASEYGGSLNSSELRNVLNFCDIPVFVESFNLKCIQSTRLSLSTKISEYLSLGKPVLAIGPSDVASMEYLQDVAFCVTETRELQTMLKDLLKNDDLRSELSKAAKERYEKYHQKVQQGAFLKQKMLEIVRS